jgi:regulator of replication initiation timing
MTPNDIILALALNLAEVVADRQQLRIENEQLKQALNNSVQPENQEVVNGGN